MARGDHIRVYRGGYDHHGIDLGNGFVVHFAGDPDNGFSKKDAFVRRDSLAEFTGDGKLELVPYPPNEVLHSDYVCVTALNQIGTGEYKLFTNNCEHLATYCKTGRKKSLQVQKSFQRMGKFSRYFVKHPAWILAGPAFELLRLGALTGWHRINQDAPEKPATGEPLQGAACRAFFRSYFGYTSADSQIYMQDLRNKWFVIDAQQGVPSPAEPVEGLTYSFRTWVDDNRLSYVETGVGWSAAGGQKGWVQLMPYPLRGRTFKNRSGTLASAPFGALNAMIEAPASLEEQHEAINEITARGLGDAITYQLLVALAAADTKQFTGQSKPFYEKSRAGALWALGVINRVQHASVPTEKLIGLPPIVHAIFDDGERDELRLAALKAIQELSRPRDPLVRAILDRAVTLRSQVISGAARRVLRGEAVVAST